MLTTLQTKKFSQQFRLLDFNENGVLTWDDFEQLLSRLSKARGWAADSPRATQALKSHEGLWKSLTTHCEHVTEGGIGLEQWLSFHDFALNDNQVLLQLNSAYEELVVSMTAFIQDSLDTDGDGTVTAKEYGEFCQAYGLSESDAQLCFEGLDRNGDGKLTCAEILDLVLEYYCSDDPKAPGNQFFGILGSQATH